MVEIVKFPAQRAGLLGSDLLFHIVPLDPAYPAKAGRGTLRSKGGVAARCFLLCPLLPLAILD